MMHMFPSFKFTSKMFFHYVTMLTDSFTFGCNNMFIGMFGFVKFFESVSWNIFNKPIFSVTAKRTIFYIIFFKSIQLNIKSFMTKTAYNGFSSHPIWFFQIWIATITESRTKFSRLFAVFFNKKYFMAIHTSNRYFHGIII